MKRETRQCYSKSKWLDFLIEPVQMSNSGYVAPIGIMITLKYLKIEEFLEDADELTQYFQSYDSMRMSADVFKKQLIAMAVYVFKNGIRNELFHLHRWGYYDGICMDSDGPFMEMMYELHGDNIFGNEDPTPFLIRKLERSKVRKFIHRIIKILESHPHPKFESLHYFYESNEENTKEMERFFTLQFGDESESNELDQDYYLTKLAKYVGYPFPIIYNERYGASYRRSDIPGYSWAKGGALVASSSSSHASKVVSLNLSGMNLVELPDFIVNFSDLKSIYLTDNCFSEFPKVLLSLPHLKKVYMKNNQLEADLQVKINEHEQNNEDLKSLHYNFYNLNSNREPTTDNSSLTLIVETEIKERSKRYYEKKIKNQTPFDLWDRRNPRLHKNRDYLLDFARKNAVDMIEEIKNATKMMYLEGNYLCETDTKVIRDLNDDFGWKLQYKCEKPQNEDYQNPFKIHQIDQFEFVIEDEHVVALSLENCNLDAIPSPISALEKIEYLNLSGNNFSDLVHLQHFKVNTEQLIINFAQNHLPFFFQTVFDYLYQKDKIWQMGKIVREEILDLSSQEQRFLENLKKSLKSGRSYYGRNLTDLRFIPSVSKGILTKVKKLCNSYENEVSTRIYLALHGNGLYHGYLIKNDDLQFLKEVNNFLDFELPISPDSNTRYSSYNKNKANAYITQCNGVEIQDYRIVAINLQNNSIQEIPNSITKLSELYYADFSENKLTEIKLLDTLNKLKTCILSGNPLKNKPNLKHMDVVF